LLVRLKLLQPDLRSDVGEFLVAHFFQAFAARLELFVDLDGFLGHHVVGLLRAADQREIIALGDALMAVGIQPEAEDRGFAFRFFGVGHVQNVKADRMRVKNSARMNCNNT